MAETGEKTESPTQRRLDQAYRRGEGPVSGEVRHAALFAALLLMMGWIGARACRAFGAAATRIWSGAADYPLDEQGLRALAAGLAAGLGRGLLPLGALVLAMPVVAGLVQGRPGLHWNRLAPRWSRLSPASGLKRVFGPAALIEFAKTLAKFALIAGAALWVAWPRAIGFGDLIGSGPGRIVAALVTLVRAMVKTVLLVTLALAAADLLYQRRAFLRRMRMTLREVRDEFKNNEGDPKIKARIRAIAQSRSRQRIRAAVPRAAVIVTNPTHYAVALDYRHGETPAPLVLAKGVDAVALRIRAIATEAKVPIVESPALARALYASAEVDRPIPAEHYAAVAEIIGYVLRLARRAG
ncbi:EscU/YscU/HrcU family type III secretion system export apparatus switch protein [Sphingomonas morindae]|uniref:EscU/YscU/HrcU family type III secretion system export apparatus switch protein n=1 Tax=Sphingomonas morindae TaxID=1541170 RepID=A0ABY4X538_9SPHN|nr:EscU/YscU/HrcU family type III secretion system export apparatus switch protein [Sphingomonas morindae]USI72006.1 EscU/YscU/HrcU family type III secretion system export apparatus switch protein [Sphingomonas morindae]